MSEAVARTPPRRLAWMRRLTLGRYTGVVVALLVVFVYLGLKEPVFLTWANWQNVFRAQAVVFVLGIGMTFVVLTGGIDLSVGSATAASAMVIGLLVEHQHSWELAVLTGIGAGFAMGLANGLMIGVLRIPFFVVTLGTLSVYQSISLLTTNGATISLFSFPRFTRVQEIVNNNIGRVPLLLLIVAALYLLGAFVLHFTAFGRSVYAVGSNPEAARLTGVRVTAVLVSVYTLAGVTAGIAAVVLTGRLTAAAPLADPNIMLTVIAAVLIGGTSFTGGDGGLLGTVIGVLFLGVIQNGLSLSGVSTFWQGTVSGVILIAAVGIGVLRSYGWRARLVRTRAGQAAQLDASRRDE